MSRVLIRTEAWGVVWDRAGNALSSLAVTIKNTDGSAATHYSAETAGTSSTAALVTDANGGVTLSGADRWLEAGEYDITVNGTTYRVHTSGVPGINAILTPSGGDDSARMASAIAALPATGGTIQLGVGTFLWNTQVPGIAPRTPTRIIGAGWGKTIIKLSSGAPRAFDFARAADFDLFQQVEITGITVDVNNVTGAHHSVVGNFVSGGVSQRTSVDSLTVDAEVINAPVDPTLATSQRIGIDIQCRPVNSDEATQLYMTNFNIKLKMAGGATGMYLGGGAADATLTPNIWIDNITADVEHDIGVTPSSNYASAHVQIGGGHVLAGKLRINVKGANSGDVGVEIDNALDAIITGTVTNAYSVSFFATNFRTAPNVNGGGAAWDVNAQVVQHVGCHVERNSLLTAPAGTACRAFGIYNNSHAFGTLIYERCTIWRTSSDGLVLGELFALLGQIQRVVVHDCAGTFENIANTGATVHSLVYTLFDTSSTPTTLEIDKLRLYATGVITGGTYTYRGLNINTTTTGAPGLDLNINDVYQHVAITASGSGSISNMIGVDLGAAGNLICRGTISNLRFPVYGTFAGRIGVLIQTTANLTIDGFLRFDQCDFANTGTASGIFCSAANINGAKVIAANTCRWPANDTRNPMGRKPTAVGMTMTLFDTLVAVTSTAAARAIILPGVTIPVPGQFFEIVDESNAAATNNITVTCAGADTFIGGGTTKVINTNGGSVRCYSNGTNWFVA